MLVGARSSIRSAVFRSTKFRSTKSGRAALVALALSFGLLGCGDDGPPPEPTKTTRTRGFARLENDPYAAVTAPARPPPAAKSAPDPYLSPLAARANETAEAAAAKEEKPRDYGAELLAGARGADACVKPRVASAALPSELLVSIEALVLESGTVVSSSARASALTPEELECVRSRLQSTRIPAGVKDAPRRINTTLKLTFRPVEPPKTDPKAGPQATQNPALTAPATQAPAAQLNPDEDLPEPVAPQDRDLPEEVPEQNQDQPEQVLPSGY